MIILEGPDGAGKTSLLHNISEQFRVEVQPRVVGSDTTAMTDLKEWVEIHGLMPTWLPHSKPRLYDRHRLISEFVYGPIMGRPPEPGFDDLSWVMLQMGMFYRQRPIIIYCMPPMEVVRANVLRAETDNSAVSDRIDSIWVAYAKQAANDCFFNGALIWDYTRGDVDTFLTELENEIDVRMGR